MAMQAVIVGLLRAVDSMLPILIWSGHTFLSTVKLVRCV